MGITTDIIYIVIAALAGGLLAHSLRQPLIFGYILAGIIVGPYTGGVTVQNAHEIEMLAEIGVALLLFTLGLEFSFGELKRLSRVTFIIAPLQIMLCTIVGYLIARALGISLNDSIWIGAAISLSSTMVVLKTLSARDALESPAGRVMLAILIAQDIAIIPLMLLLPQLTGERIEYWPILGALMKSVLFLGGMYLVGVHIFPRLFRMIMQQNSRELFFLSILTTAFGAGFVSHELGLSFALGAFVAGMLLSETDFSHQALSDVSTLRDLFALIFFVSVGMLFDPRFFVAHIGKVMLLAVVFVAAKALVTAAIMRAGRYTSGSSWVIGLGLAQVGEFAFVVTKEGSNLGLLSADSFSLIIAVTVVSMVATPALFYLGDRFSKRFPDSVDESPTVLSETPLAPTGHILIIGGGVVGQYVARGLEELRRPYVVIESNYKAVTQMRDRGITVIFGDASRPGILEAAGIERAQLAIVTTTNDSVLPLIIRNIREISPSLPIIVRVEEIEDIDTNSSLDVLEIVQPQIEVGRAMIRQSLVAIGIEESETTSLLQKLRAEGFMVVGSAPREAADHRESST